ncbi:MAG: 7-carboxy-7-deazaguanine synthase QueE [Candidatus Aminicenantes bacterium]|nr:7-carboxy-7-deazaguanine synthase QueE [Candidatus Aminicenantes bacterium]
MGEPTIFIRLTGCNLRCRFCDTKYAWSGGREYHIQSVMEKIHRLRSSYPADWVCLTGGEPFLQKMETLVRILRKEGLKIQVETNGTIYRPVRFDWTTLSPKPEDYIFQPEFIPKAKEVKLVVTKDLTLDTIRNLREAFPGRTPLLLQPQSNRAGSLARARSLLRQAVKADLHHVRLSIQMHRVFSFR